MDKKIILGLVAILILIIFVFVFTQTSTQNNIPPQNISPQGSSTQNTGLQGGSNQSIGPQGGSVSGGSTQNTGSQGGYISENNILMAGQFTESGLKNGSAALTIEAGMVFLTKPDGNKIFISVGDRIELQENGNFVIFDKAALLRFQSFTTGAVKCVLNSNGDLELFDADGKVIWNNNNVNVRIKTAHNLYLYIDGPPSYRGWQWNNVNEMTKTGRFTIVQNTDDRLPGAISLKCVDTGRFLTCGTNGTVYGDPQNYHWQRWVIKREEGGKFSIYNPSWKSYLRADSNRVVNAVPYATPQAWELFEFVNW